MAPRAYWKGYLKLSLVSCPVSLYPASSSSERVSFNRINKVTGNRVRQLLVDAESGDPVEREDIVKGYEIAKGEYVLVEDSELEAIQIESSHTITIETFVPKDEIDDRYIDGTYYLAPSDKIGQEAFAVIRDAIRDKGMVGVGRVVIGRRERVVVLDAFGRGLLASTLRHAYEVRDPASYFEDIEDIELPDEMRKLAGHIIDTKRSHFEPALYEDHYENALVDLLEQKQAGRVVEPPKKDVPRPRVVNLMDALRASVGAEVKKPAATSSPRRGSTRKKSTA